MEQARRNTQDLDAIASLAQFHDYYATYPSLAQRLPVVSAWVKAQTQTHSFAPGKPAAAVSGTLGLSTAESRLATFVAQGGTLAQYAHRHALSRHTVRNQLQAIFAKLGVNRQADLVRLLLKANTSAS